MELLKQYRVAVVGSPDAGKSTFIRNLVKHVAGRELSPDTLMKEVHWSDGRDPMGNPDTRTIKCAKIMFEYEGHEYCMYDCPGHLEYIDQIKQGISSADYILYIRNEMDPLASDEYIEKIKPMLEGKNYSTLYSHATQNGGWEYNVELPGAETFFKILMPWLRNECAISGDGHDIEIEAIELIKENIKADNKNIMFFSGGKDSVAGLKLYELAGLINCIDVYFPDSGYDFQEVRDWNNLWEIYFKKQIKPFSNNMGLTYEINGEYAMLQAKAIANESLINVIKPSVVSIQYRASDEGVRSKDYHISERENYSRFSPVFYFSETNIWRFISKYNLPINPLYFNGYRSLGDEPVTEPCMPKFKTVYEIEEYIRKNPGTTERDGRKKQDSSVPFAMEKLRDNGFF